MPLDTEVLTESDLKWLSLTPDEKQEMVFEAALRVHNASKSIPQPLVPLSNQISELITTEVSTYSESLGLEIWQLIAAKRWEIAQTAIEH